MRKLAEQWEVERGYRALLAESFSDLESHACTVYKVAIWEQAGVTKGYSQDHTHYDVPNSRPKKLWLKKLFPNAYTLMCARELPEACRGALVSRGGARSALKNAQIGSLCCAFLQVPAPRHPKSRRHPLSAMLSLIGLGLLMGARDVLDIWRKVGCLSKSQRESIGLRVRDKLTKRLKMPGYDALNDLLAAVDPAGLCPPRPSRPGCKPTLGCCPAVLALDGKSVGDGRCGMIITLCWPEDGRPVAMAPATGKKEDSEVSEARALLADDRVQLANALITADPLHNKHDTIQGILQKGAGLPCWPQGKHLPATQGSQQRPEGGPFFEISLEGDHGRIDRRRGSVAPISPIDAHLPGALRSDRAAGVGREKTTSHPKEPHPLLPFQLAGRGKISFDHGCPQPLEY